MEQVKSNYQGSKETYQLVAAQIKERYGADEVKNYNPFTNCLTFQQWRKVGFKVKKGSKALKSITFVKVEDADGNVIKSYPKTVNLFYHLDTEAL